VVAKSSIKVRVSADDPAGRRSGDMYAYADGATWTRSATGRLGSPGAGPKRALDENLLSLAAIEVTTTQGDPVRYRLLALPLYLAWRAIELAASTTPEDHPGRSTSPASMPPSRG
jgi:hypothetical protein